MHAAVVCDEIHQAFARCFAAAESCADCTLKQSQMIDRIATKVRLLWAWMYCLRVNFLTVCPQRAVLDKLTVDATPGQVKALYWAWVGSDVVKLGTPAIEQGK